MRFVTMREKWLIGTLVLFYTVGAMGMLLPEHAAFFQTLSPFNLLLTFSILLLARKKKTTNWYLFLAIGTIAGFTVEWIGVHTGYLFGNYQYGTNLGWKLDGIPVIIGFNWLLMIVGSASVAARIFNNRWYEIISAALLMTLFDVVMEPVAIQSDFWQWENNVIPIYNYVCWFLIGGVLQFIYYQLKLRESNKVNDALLLIMTVFFIILNVF